MDTEQEASSEEDLNDSKEESSSEEEELSEDCSEDDSDALTEEDEEEDAIVISDDDLIGMIDSSLTEIKVEKIGASSYMILNGGGIVSDGETTYMTLSDGVYAQKNDEKLLLTSDSGSNLNYGDGKIYYTVESEEGSIIKCLDVKENKYVSETLVSGCEIIHMYLVNDTDLLFDAEGYIYRLNLLSGICERYGSYEDIFSFIPTKYGMLIAKGSLFKYTIYADARKACEASDYYVDGEYLCFTDNNAQFQVKLTEVFNAENEDIRNSSEDIYEEVTAEEFIEDIAETDEAIAEGVLEEENCDVEDEVAVEEIITGAPAEKKEINLGIGENTLLSDSSNGTESKICSNGSTNLTRQDTIDKQEEIVNKASVVYDFAWYPLSNVREWSKAIDKDLSKDIKVYTPTSFHMHGVPYCQTAYGGKRTLIGTTENNFMALNDFIKETKKADSLLYSTNRNNWVQKGTEPKFTSDMTQDQINEIWKNTDFRLGPHYGSDCSMFVSYCYDVPITTTAAIKNSANYIKVETADDTSKDPEIHFAGIKIGDAINVNNSKSNHVVLVTDIQYDKKGTIKWVETIEQTPPCTTKRLYTSIADFYSMSNYYENDNVDEYINILNNKSYTEEEKQKKIKSIQSNGSGHSDYTLYRSKPVLDYYRLSINTPETDIYAGQKYQFKNDDPNPKVENISVTWSSSNTKAATINATTGLLNAKAAGKTDITVTVTKNEKNSKGEYIKYVATVTVQIKDVCFTSAPPTSKTIYTGESFNLEAKGLPVDGVMTYTTSNSKVATVDKSGAVVGKTAGSATIKAAFKAGGKTVSKSCKVTVKARQITLNCTSKTMYYKEKLKLTGVIEPNIDINLKWKSSDSKKVTVDEFGNVEVIKNTSTASDSPIKITATLPSGEKKVCEITLKKASTSLNKSKATLYTAGTDTNTSVQLSTTTLKPSGAIKEWTSSNSSVATVDSTGKVKALAKGTAKIKCALYGYDSNGTKFSYGVSKTCTVTVKNPSIKLSKTSITDLYTTKTKTLTATVTPSGTPVSYSSSDTSIVTVDSKGVLTGVAKGKATITATIFKGTANAKSATCKVEVKNPSLKLSKTSMTVYRGFNSKLSGTAKPTATISYSSSNTKVATVDSKGNVKGVKKGTATITAKANGIAKTCEVKVEDPKLDITKSSASVVEGKTITLKKTTTPSGATVNWKSSDTKIATVDSTGKVTGKKAGTVTITASLENASDITDTCTVTVKPVIEIEKTSVYIGVGSSETVKVKSNTGETLSYSIKSSYPSTGVVTVKKVSSGVKITAKNTGTSVINVKCGDTTKTITVNCHN